MVIVINAIREKAVDKMTISQKEISRVTRDLNIYPAKSKRTYNNKICIRYL
jgi:hypothetical protein